MSGGLPRDKRSEIWGNGTPLALAWLTFGDERRLKQRAMKRGTLASVLIEDTIIGDVFGRLATGQLLAWGFCVAPIQGDGPVPIPRDVFDQRPPDTWRDNVVTASGERFERITIYDPFAAEAEERSEFADEGHQEPVVAPPAPPEASRGGRRDTYHLSVAALAALEDQDPTLLQLSAERLHPKFVDAYRAMHPEGSRLSPPPGVRTLRTQLKRFHEEGLGKNRQ